MPLQSTEERVITEPPSTTKSKETSKSVSASPPEDDNQLPTKETTLSKLPLEAASELKTFKPSHISEK